MKLYKILSTSLIAIILTSILIIGCKKEIQKEEEELASATTSMLGSTAFCGPGETSKGTTAGKSVAQHTTVFNTDFVSAGVGGTRDVGTGSITLSGVSGTVTKAILYWHGITASTADVGNPILVNGNTVTGTNIGVSSTNCWPGNNSQAYRADVTALVQSAGNGSYTVSSFGSLNPNGASLIVFFNDGNATNNRDVVIFDGNDSNIFFAGITGNPNAPEDPAGWNVVLSGINYTTGSSNIQFHVADGQSFPDDAIKVNNVVLVPAGPIFSGASVPGAPVPNASGNLWDIKTYDVSSFLTPGPNTLNVTSGVNGDCLGLIAALIDLPAGAAPPSECVVTASCKNASVTLVNGVATISASDINNGSTASCGIQTIVASPTSFNCSNIGDNNVVLTVTDVNGNVSTCTAVVTVVGELASCSITAVPSNGVFTGGVPTNIYLGYGPQSVTLNVSAPSSGAPYTYSWSPAAGLSSATSGAPIFTPTASGSYTFVVTVTNQFGCSSSCSITINVVDVRCGKNMDKVLVCHKDGLQPEKTLCIGVEGVADHLLHGDYLGTCN